MTFKNIAMFCWSIPLLITAPVISLAEHGSAELEIMAKVKNVQRSNFGKNSFIIKNTGHKDSVAFELDVTQALFPDTVFDPEGLAGDSAAKPLSINRNEATGVLHHPGKKSPHYLGEGGARGYETLLITFDPDTDNGFNPGEVLGFSIDMDPNSIAGTRKKPLDKGSQPRWDVGGVSGAELIGSTFKVTFADDTTATGVLFASGTQAGSHGIATEHPQGDTVDLIVNGKHPSETGTYSQGGPQILVKGKKGLQVRVVLAKGFIQPFSPYNSKLENQLDTLRQAPFPANNAVEFTFVDLTLTGEAIDISAEFDFSKIQKYDFASDPDQSFSIDEDKIPLGIVAAVIDPNNKKHAAGPVTAPIYLTFEE